MLDGCEGSACLSFLALTQGCVSRSISQSSKTPAMTESESTDETVLAGTGMTSSPVFWEVLAATTLLFWPFLNTYNILRAWQVDRDVHCPLARQWGPVMWFFLKPEQQHHSLSLASNPGWQVKHAPTGWAIKMSKTVLLPGLSPSFCKTLYWVFLGHPGLLFSLVGREMEKLWRCQARSLWCKT